MNIRFLPTPFGTALALTVLIAAAEVSPLHAAEPAAKPETVRDRLWMFSFATNSDYFHLRQRSVMSAAEGNFYMGVPNILVIQAHKTEEAWGRFDLPFEPYTVAMRPLKKLVWSVTGSGGANKPEETADVLSMAKRVDNFGGVMLDDFFKEKTDPERAVWPLEQLADVRRKLDQTGKKLDIYATFYVRQFDLPVKDYLDLIDVVTIWDMDSANIPKVEENLRKFEKLYPQKRKMLGCYLVDYRKKCAVPVDLMKHQCEVGLRWLREGKIEGMIFMGNTVLDLGYESVEWTRNWIKEVGDTPLK